MGLPPKRHGERSSLRLAGIKRRLFGTSPADSSEKSRHEEEVTITKGKMPIKRSGDTTGTAPTKNEIATPSMSKKSKINNEEEQVGKIVSPPTPPPTPLIRRDVGDLLNCKICGNEPTSPICCCANGHIICGTCVDDPVKKCGICQMDLQLSNFAELLSRQFDLKLACKYQKSGCKEVIAATEMKIHLQNCYYRDITCTETKTGPCEKMKMPMYEYAGHLSERHQCLSGSPRRFVLTLEDENMLRGTSPDPQSRAWPIGIMKQDGNTFLLLSQIHVDASIFVWMTLLGSAETAEKLTFTFKLYRTMDNGKKIRASWTMPVIAYHDRPKFVEGLPCYVNISGKMLLEFCTRVELQDVPKLQFDSACRIF
ncbi:E3 ubiquitin-protein ligase sina [Folsomia candida]|uniref:E3 ubiquitin-protein ligase sina n=1 Tax=Folsomia candida TaxID=158441 RepID=A0A226DI40_FOLCA|nr:E3 ubiquitin-protein ligase sina [Folsomia candida]OXA45215.1 E3 ubiquitin-protein ligase sina [Folsomia candida]